MLEIESVINIRQLLILGAKEEYLYIGAVIIGLAVAYFLLQPIVMWFIQIGAQGALTYLITSLLLLVGLFSARELFETGESAHVWGDFIRSTLQSLAVFGLLIMVRNIWVRMRGKQKKSR